MGQRRWVVIVCGIVVLCSPVTDAGVSGVTQADARYEDAYDRGIQAFRRGELNGAARAFQEAYLIRPTDPLLKSWLALIKDEQTRRGVMTRTLEQWENLPRAQEGVSLGSTTTGKRPRKPLWERLPSTTGVERPLTPPEESRREVLTETKRAGFQRLYKEGIGFEPVRGVGLSGRVEIFEEPNPVEDYILESKMLNFSEISQFRRSITPLFTRAWASRVALDYEPWPRLTYEFDKRHILHEFDTRFDVEDRNLETHAFNALYSFPRIPYLGIPTFNPWYKRVFQESDDDPNTFEDLDEVIFNATLAQSDNVELFFQYDASDSKKLHIAGGSQLKLFRTEARLRFPQWKVFIIPGFEDSDTDFKASPDEFIKRTVFVDWGIDLTKRFRLGSKEEFIEAEVSRAGNEPSNPAAEVFNTENTLSYELFKDFDVSLGFDWSKGFGYNTFNNVGLRVEAELFKPGFIRSRFGYEWLSYYNISDDLSLIYWKLFLFQ